MHLAESVLRALRPDIVEEIDEKSTVQMIKRILVKLAAVIAATFTACITAYITIVIIGYPADAFLPHKCNWIALPIMVGVVLPLSAGMSIAVHRFVKRQFE